MIINQVKSEGFDTSSIDYFWLVITGFESAGSKGGDFDNEGDDTEWYWLKEKKYPAHPEFEKNKHVEDEETPFVKIINEIKEVLWNFRCEVDLHSGFTKSGEPYFVSEDERDKFPHVASYTVVLKVKPNIKGVLISKKVYELCNKAFFPEFAKKIESIGYKTELEDEEPRKQFKSRKEEFEEEAVIKQSMFVMGYVAYQTIHTKGEPGSSFISSELESDLYDLYELANALQLLGKLPNSLKFMLDESLDQKDLNVDLYNVLGNAIKILEDDPDKSKFLELMEIFKKLNKIFKRSAAYVSPKLDKVKNYVFKKITIRHQLNNILLSKKVFGTNWDGENERLAKNRQQLITIANDLKRTKFDSDVLSLTGGINPSAYLYYIMGGFSAFSVAAADTEIYDQLKELHDSFVSAKGRKSNAEAALNLMRTVVVTLQRIVEKDKRFTKHLKILEVFLRNAENRVDENKKKIRRKERELAYKEKSSRFIKTDYEKLEAQKRKHQTMSMNYLRLIKNELDARKAGRELPEYIGIQIDLFKKMLATFKDRTKFGRAALWDDNNWGGSWERIRPYVEQYFIKKKKIPIKPGALTDLMVKSIDPDDVVEDGDQDEAYKMLRSMVRKINKPFKMDAFYKSVYANLGQDVEE